MINILKLRKLQKIEEDLSTNKEIDKSKQESQFEKNTQTEKKEVEIQEEKIEEKQVSNDFKTNEFSEKTDAKDSIEEKKVEIISNKQEENTFDLEEKTFEIESETIQSETTESCIKEENMIESEEIIEEDNFEYEEEIEKIEDTVESEDEEAKKNEKEKQLVKAAGQEIVKDDIIAKEIQMSKEESKKESDIIQLVGFYLANELYAIDITLIREIIRYNNPTRVPRSPKYVEGVINLRGQVLPVVNLRKKLNLETKEHDSLSRIIVLDLKDYLVGFSVDEVKEVIRIPSKLTQPPPEILSVAGAQYVKSIANFQDNLILILDIEKALQHQKNDKTKLNFVE